MVISSIIIQRRNETRKESPSFLNKILYTVLPPKCYSGHVVRSFNKLGEVFFLEKRKLWLNLQTKLKDVIFFPAKKNPMKK